MRPSEEKIYNQLAAVRTAFFRPLNKVLTGAGVNADMVSYLGAFLMLAFLFTVTNHPVAAFWLIIARMFADIMDGPLARYQQTDSDRGKFVDVLMDNLGFAFFVFGVIKAGLVAGLVGSTYLFATELVVVLMIIKYNLKHKSDWLFYASAGSFPYNFMYLCYIFFAIFAFGGHSYLSFGIKIFTVLLAIKAASDYWELQKIKIRKNN